MIVHFVIVSEWAIIVYALKCEVEQNGMAHQCALEMVDCMCTYSSSE